jgi:hypothetical protein
MRAACSPPKPRSPSPSSPRSQLTLSDSRLEGSRAVHRPSRLLALPRFDHLACYKEVLVFCEVGEQVPSCLLLEGRPRLTRGTLTRETASEHRASAQASNACAHRNELQYKIRRHVVAVLLLGLLDTLRAKAGVSGSCFTSTSMPNRWGADAYINRCDIDREMTRHLRLAWRVRSQTCAVVESSRPGRTRAGHESAYDEGDLMEGSHVGYRLG